MFHLNLLENPQRPRSNFWTLWLFLLLIIIASICLSHCSPQKELQRLTKKHPELFNKIDSVGSDTVKFAGESKDTSFSLASFNVTSHDTFTIYKDNLEVKYILRHDSVFIEGKCKPIVKIVPKEIVRYMPIQKEPYIPGAYQFTFWGFIILVLLDLAFIFFLAYMKAMGKTIF